MAQDTERRSFEQPDERHESPDGPAENHEPVLTVDGFGDSDGAR